MNQFNLTNVETNKIMPVSNKKRKKGNYLRLKQNAARLAQQQFEFNRLSRGTSQ